MKIEICDGDKTIKINTRANLEVSENQIINIKNILRSISGNIEIDGTFLIAKITDNKIVLKRVNLEPDWLKEPKVPSIIP